jgi:hypothetical protein
VLQQLLESSRDSREILLDAIGDAIGVLSVSYPEIDALIGELESQGRTVRAPVGGQGEDWLRAVLSSTRSLAPQLGRRPQTSEIAEHAGLSLEQVRYALLLAQVMQR